MPRSPDYVLRRCYSVALVLVLLPVCEVLGVNVTAFLSSFPDLSSFNHLLSATGVAGDLEPRSSLTILAVPNRLLDPSLAASRLGSLPSSQISDVLRYHVLLQYLDLAALQQIPADGKLVTSLFQTTGRAEANRGAVNLTRDPLTGNVTVRSPGPFAPSNATIVSLVRAHPYTVALFTVDSLLLPSGFDLTASEVRPQVPINITRVLIEAKDFDVAGSMLAASGVTAQLEADEQGAGITVFLPTDDAFSTLSAQRLQTLSADMKAVVLKYHVLHSYYPLGSLQSIVNPVQPTLATEEMGAGSFTLNIKRSVGSVSINTGIVNAIITQTAFDQNPVAIFGISAVLLPREIFGPEKMDQSPPAGRSPVCSPPSDILALSPGSSISPASPARPPGTTGGGAMNGSGSRGWRIFLTGILVVNLFAVAKEQLFLFT